MLPVDMANSSEDISRQIWHLSVVNLHSPSTQPISGANYHFWLFNNRDGHPFPTLCTHIHTKYFIAMTPLLISMALSAQRIMHIGTNLVVLFADTIGAVGPWRQGLEKRFSCHWLLGGDIDYGSWDGGSLGFGERPRCVAAFCPNISSAGTVAHSVQSVMGLVRRLLGRRVSERGDSRMGSMRQGTTQLINIGDVFGRNRWQVMYTTGALVSHDW